MQFILAAESHFCLVFFPEDVTWKHEMSCMSEILGSDLPSSAISVAVMLKKKKSASFPLSAPLKIHIAQGENK